MLKREFANRRRTGGGRLSSLCIQTEPSSNVVHRTCLPSSTAMRLEPQIGLSLMNDTPARKENRHHTRTLSLAALTASTECASVRVWRRFLQQPRPCILELRASVAAPRLVRAPGWMQAMDGPDLEGPKQRGELVQTDRSLTAKISPLPRRVLRQRLTQALRGPLFCAAPNILERRKQPNIFTWLVTVSLERERSLAHPLRPLAAGKITNRQQHPPIHADAVVEAGWEIGLSVAQGHRVIDGPTRQLAPDDLELLVILKAELLHYLARELRPDQADDRAAKHRVRHVQPLHRNQLRAVDIELFDRAALTDASDLASAIAPARVNDVRQHTATAGEQRVCFIEAERRPQTIDDAIGGRASRLDRQIRA